MYEAHPPDETPMLVNPPADETPMLVNPPATEEESREFAFDHYALDHNDFTMVEGYVPGCSSATAYMGYYIFSGVILGVSFEMLHLHAGPAEGASFLVANFGCVGNFLITGAWVVLQGSWRQGYWTHTMRVFLIIGSVVATAEHALGYIAEARAGVLLYTIVHTPAAIFFTAMISAAVLRTRITPMQWVGCLTVVIGLLLTGIPSPIESHHSFTLGIICTTLGSLCLASFYVFTELIFVHAERRPLRSRARLQHRFSPSAPSLSGHWYTQCRGGIRMWFSRSLGRLSAGAHVLSLRCIQHMRSLLVYTR